MKINQYSNGQNPKCAPAAGVIDDIKNLLTSTAVSTEVKSGMTSKVKDALLPELRILGWKDKFPIDKSVTYDDYASFFVDMYLDTPEQECSHSHRFLLQFMFDNRQAIGTNLIKFDIAAYNAAKSNRLTTAIAICAEKNEIKKLGWDGSAASAQEYLNAITGPYESIIKFPPYIFSIKEI